MIYLIMGKFISQLGQWVFFIGFLIAIWCLVLSLIAKVISFYLDTRHKTNSSLKKVSENSFKLIRPLLYVGLCIQVVGLILLFIGLII